ncbi:MAG: hypothetical protein M0Q95_10920 [Porticoccaceae bacterium]|nr:hypothetical protein [Porticoccaceae bacterium]
MNELPKNIIGFDVRRHAEKSAADNTKSQLRAERMESIKCFTFGVFVAMAFVVIAQNISHADITDSHMSVASTQIDRPDHLVSPDMAAYIATYAHGELLTEYDMQ